MSVKFIDFADLKSRISIHQVMQMLDLKLTQKGDQYRGTCPVHHGTNPREFVITASKGLWHCFGGCGGGDQIALVAKIKGVKQHEGAHLIAEHYGLSGGTVHASPAGTGDKTAPTTVPPAPRGERGFDGETYAKTLDPAHASLEPLGISADTLRLFKAGYSGSGVNKGRLALPIHDHAGNILAFCGRSLKDEQPLLIFPKNFDQRGRLFGTHQVGEGEEFVYLCLDPLQVLKAYENGVQNAVACLGTLDSATLDALSVWMQEKDIKFIEPQ
jgi:DNA primase